MIDDTAARDFQQTVWDYYQLQGRHDLPWREPEPDGSFDPYKILVSEVMLQQTQVARVIPKYHEFLRLFPTVQALAAAPLGNVLRAWNGLGYNRRAKFLWQAAGQVTDEYGGKFPRGQVALTSLAGVGTNTAGAIVAYAFDELVVFIETNIRTVFIHHFFADQNDVADKDILALVAATLPNSEVRAWYWALMDYGSYLKQSVGNLNTASKSYAKQSTFSGSRRQIRGQVIRLLGARSYTETELQKAVGDERLASVLGELVSEGLIQASGDKFTL